MAQLARVPGFVSRHGSIHSHGMSSCDIDMSLSAVQSRHHGSKLIVSHRFHLASYFTMSSGELESSFLPPLDP